MSFHGTCTICTDYFDAETDISVTHCGHMFHNVCLTQWILTCGSQRTCPQCRARVTPKQIVEKIFINIPEEDEMRIDPYKVQNKLDEARSKIQKYKCEKQNLQTSLKAIEESRNQLTSEIKNLKIEVKNERNVVHLLKADMETLKTEVEAFRAAKSEAKQLRGRLRLLEKLEVCINGQKSEVDIMLGQYTTGSSYETKQLATFCVAMKQEYETIKESRSKLNSEVMKLKRDLHRKEELLLNKQSSVDSLERCIMNLQQNEESLTKENTSLRKKVSALQQAISSPSNSGVSAINRLLAESPAPEFLTPVTGLKKRSTKQTVSGCDKVTVKKPKLTFDSDEENMEGDAEHDKLKVKYSASPTDNIDIEVTNKFKSSSAEKRPVLSTVSGKNNSQSKLKSNYSHPLAIRNKLLSNKCLSITPKAYDGLGGHKKKVLSRSNAESSNIFRFSSSNTTSFKSKFDKLKRIKPS